MSIDVFYRTSMSLVSLSSGISNTNAVFDITVTDTYIHAASITPSVTGPYPSANSPGLFYFQDDASFTPTTVSFVNNDSPTSSRYTIVYPTPLNDIGTYDLEVSYDPVDPVAASKNFEFEQPQSIVATVPCNSTVTIPDNGPTVKVGTQLQLNGNVVDNAGLVINTIPVTWTSSNPNIVSVNQTGSAVVNAVGTATVTATSGLFSHGIEITGYIPTPSTIVISANVRG